jgi:ATP-binding cassette subfamily C (CFTR/MRP) protein 4
LSAIVVVCVFDPWVAIAVPFITVAFVYLRQRYLTASRQIKRLESITRSPVYSHISTTLEGLSTIRAFSAEDRFLRLFYGYQDRNTNMFFNFIAAGRWIGFRMEMVAWAFLTIATFVSVALNQQASLAGLSLSYVLNVS